MSYPGFSFWVSLVAVQAQVAVPSVHSNIVSDANGLYVNFNGEQYFETDIIPLMTLTQAMGQPKGNKKGISFNFGNKNFEGKLYYGFIPYGDS